MPTPAALYAMILDWLHAMGCPRHHTARRALVMLMNQAGDPPTFDLHQESTSAVTESVGPSYDNLVRFDPMDGQDKTILPDLAEKWQVSQDGKTYTFTLRKGVKFHNGNSFTAADVKFTLERVMNPPKGIKSPRQTAFDLLTWSHGFALDDPDAVYNEFYLCNAPRNWSRLCSPQVDELYMKQSQELDAAKRKELMLQLERTAVPLASKIITSWGGKRSTQWSFVKGYTDHASSYNNIRFDSVWLDK